MAEDDEVIEFMKIAATNVEKDPRWLQLKSNLNDAVTQLFNYLDANGMEEVLSFDFSIINFPGRFGEMTLMWRVERFWKFEIPKENPK